MFAIMVEMLYCTKIFPERAEKSKNGKRFGRAIVDEVDNLTIDMALNGARMSHGAEITYDWVYEPIFRFAQTHFQLNDASTVTSEVNVQKVKKYLQGYQNGKFIHLVNELLDKQLEEWIQSAYHALFERKYKENYILAQIPARNGGTREGVLIIDKANTGRREDGMRWSKGEHEFVEVKHNLDVEKESVTPLSLSTAVFYQMYRSVFGLTGTLGEKLERNELKEIYDISSFDVPTHKPSQRIDKEPIIFSDKEAYWAAVIDTCEQSKKKGQPILVLCESIAQTEVVENLLKERQISCAVLNELQNESEQSIIDKAGHPGVITVATNTAGRGTDIKLRGDSIKNGGLRVVITFYPISKRVELQARGRAGRQGEPGETEIILLASELSLPTSINKDSPGMQKEIKDLLISRRENLVRVTKSQHVTRAILERFLFSLVSDFYKKYEVFQKQLADERFLNHASMALSSRKSINNHFKDLQKINVKDRKIAQDAFNLFCSQAEETTQWKVLLKNIGQRVNDRILNDFALNFFQQAEMIITNSNLYFHAQGIDQLKTSHVNKSNVSNNNESQISWKELEKGGQLLLDAVAKKITKKIQDLFDEKCLLWEKYLHASGEGVIDYLREVTKLSLLHIDIKKESGATSSALKLYSEEIIFQAK